MQSQPLILRLSCPDRPGIVAAVSTFLFERGGNILDARQFDDLQTGTFFMRVVFAPGAQPGGSDQLQRDFAQLADRFGMQWSIRLLGERRKVLIMVSGFDHCLADLIYRKKIGELPMEIVAIASNHPRDKFTGIDLQGLDFHYLPVTRENKAGQEAALSRLVHATGAELVVLARYMQVLSDELARELAGRCINIHHSFLPGFKGARPYHQAHARGVKLIGATAHYVTGDLDEGPIIDQDVERISHADTPEDLIRKGRDIERRVLARAVLAHLEDRVFLNGSRTVVFG